MRYLTHLGSWLTRHAWWVLGGIILVAAAVRLYKFGSLPNGVFQDEASLSYDAWSLLTYGVERNGFHFPVILPAYGSGMSGTLAAYLQMPFLMIFGLTPVATRAVNLTMGLAAIPMLYLLARKVWNTQTALVAAFILAISP
jgi:4-amino-4-deoxy-L-arabinose transferase-like glycosyltransferase